MSDKHLRTDLEILLGALDKLRIQSRSEFQSAINESVNSDNYSLLWESLREALKGSGNAG